MGPGALVSARGRGGPPSRPVEPLPSQRRPPRRLIQNEGTPEEALVKEILPIALTLAMVFVGAPAQAAPTCFGKRATIVGSPDRESIVGTSGGDVIVGTANSEVIHGRGGNDLICAQTSELVPSVHP